MRISAESGRHDQWGVPLQVSRWPSALQLLAELKWSQLQPNVVALSAVVSALERAARWQHAVRLLTDFPAAPNAVTLSAACSACERASAWEMALSLLTLFGTEGRDKLVYSSVVGACVKVAEWEQALCLMRELPETDIILLSLGIAACYQGSLWCQALVLLSQLGPLTSRTMASAWVEKATADSSQSQETQL